MENSIIGSFSTFNFFNGENTVFTKVLKNGLVSEKITLFFSIIGGGGGGSQDPLWNFP